MQTIASYLAALAGIKTTTSGLVEMTNDTSSLGLVLKIIGQIFGDRLALPADIPALQAIPGTEAKMAYLPGAGFYLYETTNNGGYASVDGLGYWNRQAFVTLSELPEIDITSAPPADGDALLWNDGQSKFIPGPATVSALNWLNITSIPSYVTALATGIVLKKFASSIGATALATGNTVLAPQGHSVATATNSTVITANNIAQMTAVTDSTIMTDMTTFRPGSTPFSVNRCIIIGNPGPLTAYFNANVLADLVIIGTDGAPTFVKKANGEVFISGGSGGSSVITVDALSISQGANINGDVGILGNVTVATDLSVTGDLAAAGDTTLGVTHIQGAATMDAGATVTGTLAATGPMVPGQWSTGTRPVGVMRAIGYNTTISQMEYFNGSGWTSF